jgi:hypothetical protein
MGTQNDAHLPQHHHQLQHQNSHQQQSQPAPLEALLAQKNIPSLLGKKRKKSDRTKTAVKASGTTTTTAAAAAVKEAAPQSASLVIKEGTSTAPRPHNDSGTASGAGAGTGECDVMPDHTGCKKSRSVHFAPADPVREGGQKKVSAGENAFRLFDSVMSGANKR